MSLTLEALTYEIIAYCIKMAKSKTFCMSIGMTNLAKDVLPKWIANGDRFWGAMDKVETKELDVVLGKYIYGLRSGEKIGRPTVVEQDFNYKSWDQYTTNYPEVEITEEMHIKACTTFR